MPVGLAVARFEQGGDAGGDVVREVGLEAGPVILDGSSQGKRVEAGVGDEFHMVAGGSVAGLCGGEGEPAGDERKFEVMEARAVEEEGGPLSRWALPENLRPSTARSVWPSTVTLPGRRAARAWR